MQRGARLARELGEATLDGHVHVLVGVVGHEGAGLDLSGHGRQSVLDGLQCAGADDPARCKAPACASEASMSSRHKRQSSGSEELRRTKAASRSPAKRPERATTHERTSTVHLASPR